MLPCGKKETSFRCVRESFGECMHNNQFRPIFDFGMKCHHSLPVITHVMGISTSIPVLGEYSGERCVSTRYQEIYPVGIRLVISSQESNSPGIRLANTQVRYLVDNWVTPRQYPNNNCLI